MKIGQSQYEEEILAFQCLECKGVLGVGCCGIHREFTGHKQYEEVVESVQ